MKKFFTQAPASTANLGAGFDVFGLALHLWNEVTLVEEKADRFSVQFEISGEGAKTLPTDEKNYIWGAFLKGLRQLGSVEKARAICEKKTFRFKAVNRIPLARGLGSSAAATLCALDLAAQRLSLPRAKRDQAILNLAAGIEGHPDNVAPQRLGGFCISGFSEKKQGEVIYQKFDWPQAWQTVVCVPEFELSTRAARKVLPKKINHSDAVQNLSSASFFLAAVVKQDPSLLSRAMRDALHEPYRAKLIPGFESVKQAAVQAGAWGAALSGAGPTILAISGKAHASKVARQMESAFAAKKIRSHSFILSVVGSIPEEQQL